ncbi:PBS lyase HEAT domain protein repeat-containing protein [Ectocarpus siliculosus]|uniref:PBS lyase HEAT domain protein repeat-containing protein n=1 Tax=Ectocarpus siliculosus TaxID=2880 RepID=D8LGF0_ECTSI|nr:PBS lyase HEAT domain protein repeat-containing protein [Ectocarpus siliculosus]|eukprot:CBN75725.1 PBS lyase HEAT domain protein repeat-containing protein [Ectocarpus siliculosus]
MMQAHLVALAAMALPVGAFFIVSPPPVTTTARGSAAPAWPMAPPTMRVSGIESTPNPSSFKFDLDQTLYGPGSGATATRGITYSRAAAQQQQAGVPEAPEAILRLLEIQGVESVYALADWLCLNKKPSAKWDAIVPAAVEALGGAASSLDPLTLLMASGGEGGSAWKRSEMDGIAIRLQVSNGIPIQVEACPPGGTPLRRKLSSRFVEAMTEFVAGSGDEMAFFKGREWLPRGVRYPAEEGGDDDETGQGGGGVEATSKETAAESAVEALAAAVDEVELAYHESRLRGAVHDALDALVGFTASGEGPVPARRAAVAYIGGAGDAVGSAGLEAVSAVFRGDKNAGVRRTAGDALSDLGDPAAIPIAVGGLRDKSKLVRWRAARVVGELATREQDAVSLDEAREGEVEFEVAFEMSDAARKIRGRAAGPGEEEVATAAGVGPVWKQIQERDSNK